MGSEGATRQTVSELADRMRSRSASLRCTLAALAAWAITVAPLVATSRSSAVGRVLAAVALLPGIAGPQLLTRDNRLARHVGVSAFLAAVLAAWAWASMDQLLAAVDRFRALLGVLSWGVFAVAWSHPWSVSDPELKKAPEGETSGLKPRRRPPGYAVGVAVVGAAGALGCLLMAWTIDAGSRAVFAHAAATGCAVALITAASTVAVIAGKEQSRERRPRLPINRAVLHTILMMLMVSALALAVFLSR